MQCGIVARILIAGWCVLALSRANGADPVTLRFDISAYRVEGNSLLKQKQIQVLPRVVLRPSPKRNEVDANVEVERFGYRLALSELGDRIDTFAGYVLAGGSRR